MKKILLKLLFTLMLIVFAINTNMAQANTDKALSVTGGISVSPNRCVALRQGQVCYKDIKVNWQMPEPDDYCLRFDGDDAMIRCWTNTRKASLTIEFESSKSRTLELVNRETSQIYNQTEITLAWVYKSKKRAKASWRLF